MAWQNPKTNWTGADGVRDADLNRIEHNTQHLFENLGFLRQYIDDSLYALNQRVALNDVQIGSEFALYENGILVPFIKLSNDYASSGRALVVRKNSYMSSPLQEGSFGYYADSYVDRFLNEAYPLALDEATRAVLSDVSISVSAFNGISAISRKVFLLSRTEYNFSGNPVEGTVNYHFINPDRRIANFDGMAYEHWTRTIIYDDAVANFITNTGALGMGHPVEFTAGVRPAFTLPTGFNVIIGTPNTANTLATAEVI